MSSRLFTPFRVGGLELANRIAIAPMCQYSAVDGSMTDWHLMHLGTLALSGAGMLTIEATGVTPDGRITPQCVGLYTDANAAAIRRVVDFCRSISPIRIGIQLSHAGRKASSQRPWEGRGALPPGAGGWDTVAPSAVPLSAGWPTPRALDRKQMAAIRQAFVAAARLAADIGLDYIELHSTHGYLLSEFLSPLSNRRDDDYGGSLENRMRFPLEIFSALREAWPADRPMGAKISGSDFAEGGWMPDEKPRLRLRDRVGRRSGAGRKNSSRTGLSGAVRGKGEASNGDYHRRHRAHRRCATGRADSCQRQSGFHYAGTRHAF